MHAMKGMVAGAKALLPEPRGILVPTVCPFRFHCQRLPTTPSEGILKEQRGDQFVGL